MNIIFNYSIYKIHILPPDVLKCQKTNILSQILVTLFAKYNPDPSGLDALQLLRQYGC